MKSALLYINGIWKSRYFWSHLAFSDVRAKYRRSLLGILWAMLFPLFLTLLLSLVMGHIFRAKINEYAPYVYTGVVIWDFITGSTLAGCNAFINSETYIKQCNHPLVIYPLRVTLSALINFSLSMFGVFIWIILWNYKNIGISWLFIPFSTVLLFYICWPISIISGFINAKFRDFNQIAILGLQAVWYVSPVFINQEIFRRSSLSFLVDYNPIYHLLNLFREPLLHGNYAPSINYVYTISTGAVLWIFAIFLIIKKEKKIIFYL